MSTNKFQELIEQFDAEADDGTLYQVCIYQTIIAAKSLDGQISRVKGLKDAVLSDGGHLNFKSERVFEILDTGEIIRKID